MQIVCESAEQAFHETLDNIRKFGIESSPRGQKIKEIINFNLTITDPRNRMVTCWQRKMSPAYAFGELTWYMDGKNDVDTMKYYSKRMGDFSDDGETLNSAYGFRIFRGDELQKIGFNQWTDVVNKLRKDEDTRQAIIHLHTPNDKPTKDEVCTLTLQFFIRNGKLDMITTMRSNDLVWGFTYDVFSFTMLQEMMANTLHVELGEYHHNVGSMHVYERHFDFLDRSNRDFIKLPAMDPLPKGEFIVNDIFLLEDMLRYAEDYDDNLVGLYWDKMESEENSTVKFWITSFYCKYLRRLPIVRYDLMNEALNKLRESNETYSDVLCNFFFKGSGRKTVVEGIDGIGKTTFINDVLNKLNPTACIQHYCKPSSSFCFENYVYNILNDVDIIFDRFMFSELAYKKAAGVDSEIIKDRLSFLHLCDIMSDKPVEVFFLTISDKQIETLRLDDEDKKQFDLYERVAQNEAFRNYFGFVHEETGLLVNVITRGE